MRCILTLISMIYSTQCLSQAPNPDLFQTWYLYDYYSTDDNIHHPIAAINPAISPYITLTTASNFNGEGACNSFNGTFNASDGLLQFNNFSSTLLLCSSVEHLNFEGAYFSFIQSGGGQYYLSGQGNNMELLISNPIFINYVFGNSQLASPHFDLNQAVVYPNPANSKLFVNAQSNTIDQIEIFNSLGQMVKRVDTGFAVIDISDFVSGIYFMQLYSGEQSACKKIIKR